MMSQEAVLIEAVLLLNSETITILVLDDFFLPKAWKSGSKGCSH